MVDFFFLFFLFYCTSGANTLWFTLSDCVPVLLPLATVAVLLT